MPSTRPGTGQLADQHLFLRSVEIKPDILVCGTEGSEIYCSTDKGLNWLPISRALAINAVFSVEIHPDDPEVIYAETTMESSRHWMVGITG